MKVCELLTCIANYMYAMANQHGGYNSGALCN